MFDQAVRLWTQLAPVAGLYARLTPPRQVEVVHQARSFLEALPAGATGSRLQAERLQAMLGSHPEKALPQVARLARGLLETHSASRPTLFGTLPLLDPGAVPLAAEFVRHRLEAGEKILERLEQLRLVTAPHAETLAASYRDLLGEIQQVRVNQTRMDGELRDLSTDTAARLCREATSHYLRLRFLESLFMAHDRLAQSLQSEAVNGAWAEPEAATQLVDAAWVGAHREDLFEVMGRAGLSSPDQVKALMLLEDYERTVRLKGAHGATSLARLPYDEPALAVVVVKRTEGFYTDPLLAWVVGYLMDTTDISSPLESLRPAIEEGRCRFRRQEREQAALFPQNYEIVPANGYRSLDEYLRIEFGIDLEEVHTHDREAFQQIVGVTPRTVLSWGQDGKRPRVIGSVVALYHYLVEYVWQQRLLHGRIREGVVALPDPVEILRFIYGKEAAPFFDARASDNSFDIRVPIPPEVADLTLERFFYGPVLARVFANLELFPQGIADRLRELYGEAVTGSTLRRHRRGVVDPRGRIDRSRETERLLLGPSLDLFLEVRSFLQAVGVPIAVAGGEQFVPPRPRSRYRVILAPAESIAADLSEVVPTVDLAAAPLCYYEGDSLSGLLDFDRVRLESLEPLLGVDRQWPVMMQGVRVQTLGGLLALGADLNRELVQRRRDVALCRDFPEKVAPSTRDRLVDFVHRVLRFHAFVQTMMQEGHVRWGHLEIDFQFAEDEGIRSSDGRNLVLGIHPGWLFGQLALGRMTLEEAQRVLQFRVVRAGTMAYYGLRTTGPEFDEALASQVLASQFHPDGDAAAAKASLLSAVHDWEQAVKAGGEDLPWLGDDYVRDFLRRPSVPRSLHRPRSTAPAALTPLIVRFFWRRFGIAPERVQPFVDGIEFYLRSQPDAATTLGRLPFAADVLTGAVAQVFGPDEIQAVTPLFLELLAALGFPIGGEEERPRRPAPAVVPPLQQPVSFEGLLGERLDGYVRLLPDTERSGARLLIRQVISQCRSMILAGQDLSTEALHPLVEAVRAEIQETTGLVVGCDPIPFVQALGEDVRWLGSAEIPVAAPMSSSDARTLVQRFIVEESLTDVSREATEWFSSLRFDVLEREEQLRSMLDDRSLLAVKDQRAWWAQWTTLAVKEKILSAGEGPAEARRMLEGHTRWMGLLHPAERDTVGDLATARWTALPAEPVQAPAVTWVLPGRTDAVSAYLRDRYGKEAGHEGARGRLRDLARGLPVAARETIVRDAIGAIRVAQLGGDGEVDVVAVALQALQSRVRGVTTESTLFQRVQGAWAGEADGLRRSFARGGDNLEVLLDLADADAAKDQEEWKQGLVRLGSEMGGGLPTSWGGLERSLERHEVMALLLGEDPLVFRRRVEGVLATLPEKADEAEIPPIAKAQWPVQRFALVPEAQFRAFWREFDELSRTTESESLSLVVYFDPRDGSLHAVGVSDAEFDRINRDRCEDLTTGTLVPYPITTRSGQEIILSQFFIRSLFRLPTDVSRGLAAWGTSLTPEGIAPKEGYADVQFLLTTSFYLRGLGPFLEELIPTLQGLQSVSALRDTLNRFYGDHREAVERGLRYYHHLGGHYLSEGLARTLREAYSARPHEVLCVTRMLDLPLFYPDLPGAFLAGIKAVLVGYEGKREPTQDDLIPPLLGLWPDIRDFFFKKRQELALVSPLEVDAFVRLVERFLASPAQQALEQAPEWTPFYRMVNEIVQRDTGAEVAAMLARLLYPEVARSSPSYVYALRDIVTSGAPDVVERVKRFYSSYRDELLWRLWEVGDDFSRMILPREAGMPPKFSLAGQFPEAGALTYAEVDAYRSSVALTIRHPNQVAIDLQHSGLTERVIVPASKSIIATVTGGKLVTGVVGRDGRRFQFRSIMAHAFGLEASAGGDPSVTEVEVIDVEGKVRVIRGSEVVFTHYLTPSLGEYVINTLIGKVLEDERLRDIHPLLVITFNSTLEQGMEGMSDREKQDMAGFYELLRSLPGSVAQRTPQAVAQVREAFLRIYKKHRLVLRRCGIHSRFADLIR